MRVALEHVRCEPGDLRQRVLAVVEGEQRARLAQPGDDQVRGRAAGHLGDGQRAGDRGHDAAGRDGAEVDPPDARVVDAGDGLRREPGLADARGAGQRHEPLLAQQRVQRGQVAAAAEEARLEARQRRRSRRGQLERPVLEQDHPLQLAQLRAGSEPELVRQRAPHLLVGLQRLGLAPRAVERDHQLSAGTLAAAIGGHRCPQLAAPARGAVPGRAAPRPAPPPRRCAAPRGARARPSPAGPRRARRAGCRGRDRAPRAAVCPRSPGRRPRTRRARRRAAPRSDRHRRRARPPAARSRGGA